MRKYAILLIAALLLLLPSCQSIEPMEEDEYEYPDAGMFPQRYIPVIPESVVCHPSVGSTRISCFDKATDNQMLTKIHRCA